MQYTLIVNPPLTQLLLDHLHTRSPQLFLLLTRVAVRGEPTAEKKNNSKGETGFVHGKILSSALTEETLLQ
jgi:hypothetical protein